jgi:2-polyprenyl-6-methoxyphenol hydroxylase-like FAD-dependent oxidoreductase
MDEGEEYLSTSYIAPRGRFILSRRRNPQRIQIYLRGKSLIERLKTVQRGDVSEEKKVFAEVFRGAGWEMDEIMVAMMDADDFYCGLQGLVQLDPWYKGHTVLLGDAAYCPSASTDMGTSSAIVGAYILAGEIGRHCQQKEEAEGSYTAALQAYDDKFRPFMGQVQKDVGDPSVFDNIPSPFTIGSLDKVLWLASCLRLYFFEGFLSDQPVKRWQLPDYESLKMAE